MPIASILTAAFALAAARSRRVATSDARLRVVVSLPPQVWLVESIGGPRVEVAALVGPGDSEETYSPTDAQVSAALRGEVFFRIGASFEEAPWFRALDAAERLEIVDTRDGVELIPMHGNVGPNAAPGTSSASLDPHLWTSPRRLAIQARTVAATLAAARPRRSRRSTTAASVRSRASSRPRSRARRHARAVPRAARSSSSIPPGATSRTTTGCGRSRSRVDGKQPTDRDLTRLLELARASVRARCWSSRRFRPTSPRRWRRDRRRRGAPSIRSRADVPANLRSRGAEPGGGLRAPRGPKRGRASRDPTRCRRSAA